ncbi:hypothetical protein F4825DRAFT_333475 [Nemania diffusa]|nr:hypothetical protein F4825DRAFT_333475 [Nemania diffusa]
MAIGAPAIRAHIEEVSGLRDSENIPAAADQGPDAISTIQTKLPSRKEDYVNTNTLEPAEETVAEKDCSRSQGSGIDHEPRPADDSVIVGTIRSIEDAVISLPEGSAINAENSNAEPPLLMHELLHAQDDSDEPMVEYSDRTIPKSWPILTDHTGHTPVAAESVKVFGEDAAWESVDEDQTSEQVWETTDDDEALEQSSGDIDAHARQNILSTISEAAHEPNEDSGAPVKSVSQEDLYNFMPPEALSHNLSSPDILYTQELNPQSPEGTTSPGIQHPESVEASHQYSSLDRSIPTRVFKEDDIPVPDNSKAWTPDVAPLRPPDGEGAHRGQPFDSINVGKTLRQLDYFDSISESSDDEFVVKRSPAAASIGYSKQTHSFAPNGPIVSFSKEVPLEAVAQEIIESTDPGQDNRSFGPSGQTLDETLLVAENESRGWSTISEEEYGDTEGETQQLPYIFDYTGFTSERLAFYSSREAEELYSDDESEGITAPGEIQRHGISHLSRGPSVARGETRVEQSHRQYEPNWPFTRSSSRDKSEQMHFEPLLDDDRLGTIDVAFAPTKALAAAQVQDQASEHISASDLDLESASDPAAENYYIDNSTSAAGAAAVTTGGALLVHSSTPKDEDHTDVTSSQEIRRSRSNSLSENSEFLRELPVVPISATERVGSGSHRQLLLARAEASTNEDPRDRNFQLESTTSSIFEYSEPIHSGLDQAEDPNYYERRPIPPRSSRRLRPILVHSDDEGRDRHYRQHRSHRSGHHSSRPKDSISGDEHRHRRHHRSKDDSNPSLRTASDRSTSSRHDKGESRRHDSGHEGEHGSSHHRRRTPEEQAAHDKRKEERRRVRDAEKKKRETGSGGLRGVFKKLFT